MTAEAAPQGATGSLRSTWVGEHEAAAVAVTELLRRTVDGLPGPGRAACRDIVDAGGKGIRPELVLRCAGVCPPSPAREALVATAAAVELLHLATLVHDDLIDDSDVRRGVPAVHRRAGVPAAVVTGDALIAASLRLALSAGADYAAELVTALIEMCAGEALEGEIPQRTGITTDDVLDVARGKTGALIRAACRIGSRHAGLPERDIEAFGDFGLHFGTALQVVDDVLDFVSESDALGKPVRADLAAGTITLPAVLAMGAGPGRSHRPSAELNATDRCELGRRVISSGAVVAAAARSGELARSAAAALAGVGGDRDLVDALAGMPLRYVRDHLNKHVAPAHREAIVGAVG